MIHPVMDIDWAKKMATEKSIAKVGLTEFESVTSCPPDMHANQLRYSPKMFSLFHGLCFQNPKPAESSRTVF